MQYRQQRQGDTGSISREPAIASQAPGPDQSTRGPQEIPAGQPGSRFFGPSATPTPGAPGSPTSDAGGKGGTVVNIQQTNHIGKDGATASPTAQSALKILGQELAKLATSPNQGLLSTVSGA